MSLTNEEMEELAITMTDRYFEFLPDNIRYKIMSDKESYEKKRSLIYEVAIDEIEKMNKESMEAKNSDHDVSIAIDELYDFYNPKPLIVDDSLDGDKLLGEVEKSSDNTQETRVEDGRYSFEQSENHSIRR